MEEEPTEDIRKSSQEESSGGGNAGGNAGSASNASDTTPHWRKTKEGKWVLCGPEAVMTPGATVEVFRKDGSSSTHKIAANAEAIGKPFESFDNPNEMLVYAYDYEEVKEKS